MKYFLILMFLVLVSCKDECNYESTACQGENVVICNSEGNWQTVTDCTLVNPGLWECCENAMEYENTLLTTCVPIDTCEIDGGTD
jgi:hypothetical protein